MFERKHQRRISESVRLPGGPTPGSVYAISTGKEPQLQSEAGEFFYGDREIWLPKVLPVVRNGVRRQAWVGTRGRCSAV